MTVDDAWDALLAIGVSRETLEVVTCINGYSMGTMESVLYAVTGYNTFDQLHEEWN